MQRTATDQERGPVPSRGVELAALLARVEAATECDANLIVKIAVTLLPDHFPCGWDLDAERTEWRVLTFQKFVGVGAWNDAALALVERMRPDYRPQFFQADDLLWKARLRRYDPYALALSDPEDRSTFASAPLALLAALLRSLIEETDQRDGSIPPASPSE